MLQAETIVGNSSDFSSLQKWVSGEFNNITKYLQKLIGTNHPMLETAKRCTYISEGRMGSAQARGLTVLLTARAIEDLTYYSFGSDTDKEKLIKDQTSLAEMTEITYSAYMIHRGVMDLKLSGLEAVDYDGKNANLSGQTMDPIQAKGLHYGNKVSVLCGDFLLAYVMRGLGDLFNHRVVDLIASAISEFMEGEFLLIDDWRSKNYLLSEKSRDFKRWQQKSYATVGSLQGNTCQAALVLANIDGKLQQNAREFGKNLGLAWRAHSELQPFLQDTYEPIELPEMHSYPAFDLNCLPVLLFLRESHKTEPNYRLMINEIKKLYPTSQVSAQPPIHQHKHEEAVDYSRLHQLVVEQKTAIDESYKIIRGYSQKAVRHLDAFPPSEAKDVLVDIAESLYAKG